MGKGGTKFWDGGVGPTIGGPRGFQFKKQVILVTCKHQTSKQIKFA